KIVGEYVEKYNSQRLHSAIGYITPNDRMAGKSEEIWKARDEKLQKARTLRKLANATSSQVVGNTEVADSKQAMRKAKI
ncbi:MAG: hypothetical protein ACK5NT_05620, partial [Pyrinomonadaceae bacterium]